MISTDELKSLCDRIVKSGELGRSRTYAAILDYLAEHAVAGTVPKEISIAIDVLGREPDFDVGKDSIVRVHIYHLRNKLNTYFARMGQQEKYRLEIPKGQYVLAITENGAATAEPAASPAEPAATPSPDQPARRINYTPWLAALAFVILGLGWLSRLDQPKPEVNPFFASKLWQPLLDDNTPVLVLVGDYYIMGEQDKNGNVRRMVREFDINSPTELAEAQAKGEAANYRNLELGYAPTSIPKALAQVMKVFGAQSGRVKVKMMSDLRTTDLVGNHIIYLGLISGLRSLNDLMFANSGLAIGDTYDELINLDDDTSYNSSSGLSVGSNYHDFGMVSTFPSPDGNQFVLLAGMRDEGLSNLAEEVTTPKKLAELEQTALGKDDKAAFEALYEVLGYDSTNFEARLVYHHKLDTKVLWEARLIGGK
ncbi:MAG TPA: hypothetical protein VMH83_14360 [Candidatus Acidoferrum sp.]|nr:hypothetical protein [Candidatus Acidoferrum sp.]